MARFGRAASFATAFLVAFGTLPASALTLLFIGDGGDPMPAALAGFGPVATFNTIQQTHYLRTDPAPTFVDGGGTWSGRGLVMNNPPGTDAGLYAEPYNDPTNYLAVLKGREETVTYSSLKDRLAFYWGSMDTYNVLTLAHGSETAVVPVPPPGDGNQFADYSNRYVEITGFAFDEVVFGSNGNSFEFDNVTTADALAQPPTVPEPSVWVMTLIGFVAMGSATRLTGRRRPLTASPS